MQGIFVAGRRAKSKAEVKRAAAEDARAVSLEATSIFGNEYDGPLDLAPEGTYYFVGPCPRTKRSFYGQVIVGGGRVTVK